ncbi:M48 family metalloprotease [Methylorubrum sp. SB2]|uniref:M48 family metalloprotease n=1 Tax=Methylorubrum subtropicum TaxID=3138812 RepID=UPI00313BC2CE
MNENQTTSSVLSGAKLSRASWSTPIWMTLWLVVLAYAVSYIIAGYMGQPNSWCRRCAPTPAWNVLRDQIGLLTPLWWGLGVSAFGMAIGLSAMVAAEERTQKALNFRFLDNDHTLTRRVHTLAARLDLPPPRVGIMNAANAFAVGTDRRSAAVILGVPLINSLRTDELDAVIGHELGHIASGDMRGMVFAEGYQSMFGAFFATIGIIIQILLSVALKSGHAGGGTAPLVNAFTTLGRVLFGFVGEVLTKGLSRKREFYADAIGAAVTSPDAMTRVLQRLEGLPVKATPAENKYAYLMFKGRGGDLFSTHPSTADRIAALQSGAYLTRMKAAHLRSQPHGRTGQRGLSPTPAAVPAKKDRIEPTF